jgi:hypothetical protein
MKSKFFKFSLGILLLLSILGLTGCKALGLTTPEPVRIDLSQSFTSPRFGYTISIPETWIVNEKPSRWLDFRWPYPPQADGTDVFSTYVEGQNVQIAVGARALPEEATLELAEQNAAILMADGTFFVCGDVSNLQVASSEPITIGGEPGVLLQAPCPEPDDILTQVALAIHNGQTFWFVWQTDPGNGTLPGNTFLQILETVEFTN